MGDSGPMGQQAWETMGLGDNGSGDSGIDPTELPYKCLVMNKSLFCRA